MNRVLIHLMLCALVMATTGCDEGGQSINPDHSESQNSLWLEAQSEGIVLDTPWRKYFSLKEVMKSPAIKHIGGKIFILDSNTNRILIYSHGGQLDSYFGKTGEGPAEFKWIEGFKVLDDSIFISSPGRISYFSKSGRLKKEKQRPAHLIPCYPVADRFLATAYQMRTAKNVNDPFTYRIVLVNPNFRKEQLIYKKKVCGSYRYNFKKKRKERHYFSEHVAYDIYLERIYIGFANFKTIEFHVFDKDGKQLFEVQRPYKIMKISQAYKDSARKSYIENTSGLRVTIFYKENFPSFQRFSVRDGKVYILQHPGERNRRLLICDLNFNLLKSVLLPVQYKEDTIPYRYSTEMIHNGYMYSLIDNEDTGKWEIWRKKIH